jgi:hypothetical protein
MGASAEAEIGSRASTEPASSLGPSGFDPARRCEECGGNAPLSRVVVEGKRLCILCRDKWLIEETDSFAIASRLTNEERVIVLALSPTPRRIGLRTRVPIVDRCEFDLFGKVWRGDCNRYFLSASGVEVKDAIIRLEASAGEAGTAETTKIGSVHEHATAEGGDAQTQSGPSS